MELRPGTRVASFQVLAHPDERSPIVRARARGGDGRAATVHAVARGPAPVAAKALARFVQDATAAGALGHPSIAPVLAAGADDALVYWVTPPATTALARRGRLALGAVLRAARDVAQALVAAHDAGLPHGTLGPAHVLAGADGATQLDGFGLAALSTRPQPVDGGTDLRAFAGLLDGWLARTNGAPAAALALVQALRADDPARRPATAREVLSVLEPLAVEAALAARRRRRLRTVALATLAVVAIAAAGARVALGRGSSAARHRPGAAPVAVAAPAPEPPLYRRLSFRRGQVTAARFAPDGDSIVFAASWDASPVRLSTMRIDSDSHWSSELELPAADVLDVSRTGDMLIALAGPEPADPHAGATLAQVPLLGQAPRAILEAVQEAAWTHDGRIAVTRVLGDGHAAIELPAGRRWWSGTTWPSHVRPSPDGERLALFEHPRADDPAGRLVLCGPDGELRSISGGWRLLTGLAWSPDGTALWLSGARGDERAALWEVSLGGEERVVARAPRDLTLQDVQQDGRALVTTDRSVVTVRASAPAGTAPRELGGLARPTLVDASPDGGLVLLTEQGGSRDEVLVLDVAGGGAPVRLGAGQALALSPDGRLALVRRDAPAPRLALVPVSGGPDRTLATRDARPRAARFVPDPGTPTGMDVLLQANPTTAGWFRLELDGSGRVAVPDSARFSAIAVSPDGRRIVGAAADGLYLAALDDGAPPARRLAGAPAGAWPLRWTPDGRAVLAAEAVGATVRVHRVDVVTGRAHLVTELTPPDRAGARGVPELVVDGTATTWVLATTHHLSELYVVEGL